MKRTYLLGLMLAMATSGCQESEIPPDGGHEPDGSAEDADAYTPDAGEPDGEAPDGETPDGGGDADVAGPTCVTELAAGAQNARLCDVLGPVRHVRIEDVSAPAVHASAQLFIGLDTETGSQTPLTPGQFKVQLYGGGPGGPDAQLDAFFGPEGTSVPGDHMFIRASSTVCFDIHDGSPETRAAFVFWRDDVGGADCHDRSTLTLENAYARLHAPTNGAIIKDAGTYYYQAGSVTTSPTITLFDSLAVQDVPEPPGPSCSSAIATTGTSRVVELCETEGTVHHVRIANLGLAATHTSAQVLFGLDAPPSPTSAPGPLAADQWKVQLYGGGPAGPSVTQPPDISTSFGARVDVIAGDHAFLLAASTVCFDVHDGSASTPPYFVIWRDGVNGADCEDFTTLTLATAYGMELAYGRAVGAVDKGTPIYFYQTAHAFTPKVTLFDEPALTAEEAAAGLSCATTWTDDAFYQPLCRPAAGRPHHIRIEDAASTIANKYFYLVLNETTLPAAGATTAPVAPAAGDGRLVFTGGTGSGPTSRAYFRFNAGSTDPAAAYVLDDATPLFSAAHDVCMDLVEVEVNDAPATRVRFWATGANGADCEDFASLTPERALYDGASSSDAFWTAPLGEPGYDLIKISGSTAGATLGRVVLFSEPAVY